MMLLFEIKKITKKSVNKVAILLLLISLIIVSFLAISGLSYTESDGSSISGIMAAKKMEHSKEPWEGYITNEVLEKVISENNSINQSPEYQSDNVTNNNIAYSRKQGFSDIREMINLAFSDFQSYDYYRADTVSQDEVASIYENRINGLKKWLNSDEIKDNYSSNEKEYLISQFEKMNTPVYYTYADGWKNLLEYSSIIIVLTVLITGFLVSGIFSNEFSLKADSIYFSTRFGRNRGTRAKIMAGLTLQSGIYWIIILLYTGIVLFTLGTKGGTCVIQTGMAGWKSFYNITYIQEYLLIIFGGYIGNLFILALSMLISAKSRSAILAVTVPFIIMFVPSILNSTNISSSILGLLPDQILQINSIISSYNLYQFGNRVIGAIPILFIVYLVLYIILIPMIYRIYHKVEIK